MHFIWEDFLKIVREELGSRVVETWFKAVSMTRWDSKEKVIYLQTPNAFVCNWLEKNYRSVFQVHLGRLLNVADPKVVFLSLSQKKNEDLVVQSNEAQVCVTDVRDVKTPQLKSYRPAHVIPYNAKSGVVTAKLLERYGHINKKYVFETFVVGPSNSLAYAAACAVAQKPGDLYNPLFIYGGSGLGKTHLLHAIGNAIQANNKKALVLYQTADRFVSEFINAIRFDKIERFQKKYQLVDVLLIDDIQFISNKDTTQEAFFHIFNSLYDARKQIVFSSDTFPQNINGIAERLRSRLSSGMIADIHQPCIEVKTAILKRKAESSGELLSDEVAHFLAAHVTSNIRELEGALIRVIAFAHLTKESISLALVQKVFFNDEGAVKESVDFKMVVKAVAKHFPYSLDELRSENRNKELVLARQLTMYIMKKNTNRSLREIGAYLGDRNHTTVKHALSKIEQYIIEDAKLQRQISVIEKEFER
ncbi:MAG TPA: chromosomal replication initiator protein DnaA [Candidatus Babeliales bacterium]|jgi:chromosomal replication initiator protein|nr:chromosomal replication initiator protein DnaA [Candidatus Babeliales bacterium]